jgi:hypothetical protein
VDEGQALARKPVNPVASLRQVVLKDWAIAAVAGPRLPCALPLVTLAVHTLIQPMR